MLTDTPTAPTTGYRARIRRRKRAYNGDWKLAWPFLLPLLVIIGALIAYPFIYGIILSFQNLLVGGEPTWAGLGNFDKLLFGAQYGPQFRQSAGISFEYTLVAEAAEFGLGLGMALLLNQRFPLRVLVRAIFFLPWAVPVIVVGLDWRLMYDGSPNGLFNMILGDLGFHGVVQFLSDPGIALWSVIVAAIWHGTPFWTMMFLAGLQAVPQELYEAASIDGSGTMRRFWHVTLPSLRPTIFVTGLLTFIWTMNNSITLLYMLTQGGPENATMTFPMLAYTVGLTGGQNLGVSAAVSVMFLPLFAVLIYLLTRRLLAPSTAT